MSMSHAIRAWSFLILISLTLIVLGDVLLGREGLLISLSVVLSINAYVYFFEDERVLRLFKTRPIEGQDPWGFRLRLKKVCKEMRVPIPEAYILPHSSPQALILGRSLNKSTLILTEGFFEKLTAEEREATYMYLLANVKNYNSLAFCVGSFMVSSLLATSNLLDMFFRFLIFEKKNPEQAISQPFTRIIAPIAGIFLKLSIRPSFYFSSDQLAAEYLSASKTCSEKDLATALWKLSSYSYTEPFPCPLCTSHMFIVNPLTTQSWNRYFHAQPNADNRIRALIGHYPI